MYLLLAWMGNQRELCSRRAEDLAVAQVLASDAALDPTGKTLRGAEPLLVEEHMRATVLMAGRVTTLGG